MKTITLTTLSLRNFKGCRELTLNLNGRSASIYGDNEAGKSTVYDALTWLLFGKDHQGNAPGTQFFQIKPLNVSGEVADHGAETSVEAVFSVNGKALTLRRTYFELWTKKRGRKEAVYDGNSSEFFVDGIPMKKNEYDSRIAELVDEQTFRTLTDVYWFCEGEKEDNRRAALFDLIGSASDTEILESDPVLAPLAEALCGQEVDMFKSGIAKKRRNLNKTMKDLPGRLDECKRTVSNYENQDFDALRSQRKEISQQMEAAQQELNALRSQSGADALLSQHDGLKMQLEALEQQNTAHRASQQNPARREMLERERSQSEAELKRLSRNAKADQEEIQRLEAQIQQCREHWTRFNAEMKHIGSMSFTPGACPHCGQALPAEQVEAHQKQWEEEQRQKLEDARQRRDQTAEDARLNQVRIDQLRQRIDELYDNSITVESRLAQVKAEQEQLAGRSVANLPEYVGRRAELTHQLVELEEQLGRMQQDSSVAIAAARQRFNQLGAEASRLDGLLGTEKALNDAQTRIRELEQQRQNAAQEMEHLDNLLDLCDHFTRTKANYIDQKVNGLFRYVGWQLFYTQNDGALVDCCRATIQGVPFGSANSAARINAGLDVIETLSAAKGIRVPLFVDNAESVTRLAEIGTQVIRLVVSKGDKTLRMEV